MLSVFDARVSFFFVRVKKSANVYQRTKMDTTPKKTPHMSIADVEKMLTRFVKQAIASMTQITDGVAIPGCFSRTAPVSMRPAQVTHMQYAEVMSIIRAKMPLVPECSVKVCDAFITTYTDDVFLMMMKYIAARNTIEYQAEKFDCDDFSVAFCSTAHKWHGRIRANFDAAPQLRALLPRCDAMVAGNMIPRAPSGETAPINFGGSPIGMCHGKLAEGAGEHAFNFWLTSTGEIVFIEPQTGEFITFGTGASIDFVYI